MMLPYEVWDHILQFINDPRDIGSCRRTCHLFNNIMTNRTSTIRENPCNPLSEVDEYWPSLSSNHSLTMKFLLSFKRLQYLDFPVLVNNYTELSLVGILSNLKKIVIRLDDSLDPTLLIHFFSDYKNGYVLDNGVLIKKKRTLHNVVFKIIRRKTVRWISEDKYSVIHLDHRRGISGLDINIMYMLKIKTLYTNCVRERIQNNLDITQIYFVSPLAELDEEDFEAYLRCTKYTWLPSKSRSRYRMKNKDVVVLSQKGLSRINELRPLPTKYHVPVHFQDLENALAIYPNLTSIGVYLPKHHPINYVLAFCSQRGIPDVTIYSYGPLKYTSSMFEYIDLNSLQSSEQIIDNVFHNY